MPSYVFDLGDGTSLWLGTDYYPEEEDAPWPAGEFEIVRTVGGDHLLGIFGVRIPLDPIRSITLMDIPENAWGNLPDGEIIVPGNPTEVLNRLCH